MGKLKCKYYNIPIELGCNRIMGAFPNFVENRNKHKRKPCNQMNTRFIFVKI